MSARLAARAKVVSDTAVAAVMIVLLVAGVLGSAAIARTWRSHVVKDRTSYAQAAEPRVWAPASFADDATLKFELPGKPKLRHSSGRVIIDLDTVLWNSESLVATLDDGTTSITVSRYTFHTPALANDLSYTPARVNARFAKVVFEGARGSSDHAVLTKPAGDDAIDLTFTDANSRSVRAHLIAGTREVIAVVGASLQHEIPEVDRIVGSLSR